MPNISKIVDPRSWAKWIASGAVSHHKPELPYEFDSVRNFLRNSYVTRQGTIDPWGTIRILVNGAVPWASEENLDACDVCQPGLPIWSAKLVGFTSDHRASVVGRHIVVRKGNRIIAKISADDCKTAEIHECVVDASGHLQAMICVKEVGINRILERAHQQAEHGKRPTYFDNSTFVLVAKELAGSKLVEVGFRGDDAVVFTKDGRQIPCVCHKPLAYAKWGVDMPAHEPWSYPDFDRDFV